MHVQISGTMNDFILLRIYCAFHSTMGNESLSRRACVDTYASGGKIKLPFLESGCFLALFSYM